MSTHKKVVPMSQLASVAYVDEVANSKETAETVTNDQKEEKIRIPDPVMLKTAGGDTIILVPRKDGYDKYYFAPGVQNFDSAKPTKVKKVKFPVNREKTRFTNCWDLFMHLIKDCGYQRMRNA